MPSYNPSSTDNETLLRVAICSSKLQHAGTPDLRKQINNECEQHLNRETFTTGLQKMLATTVRFICMSRKGHSIERALERQRKKIYVCSQYTNRIGGCDSIDFTLVIVWYFPLFYVHYHISIDQSKGNLTVELNHISKFVKILKSRFYQATKPEML